MMIAVQTIRAQARAPVETTMSVRSALAYSMRRAQVGDGVPLLSKKRKRDCWEAYDYQMHMQQKMRYSLLRGSSSQSDPQEGIYPRKPLDICAVQPQQLSSEHISSRVLDEARTKRRHQTKAKKARRVVKMTKKQYNKKKVQEMRDVTDQQIQKILDPYPLPMSFQNHQRVNSLRRKAVLLDNQLRGQCHSIMRKEHDIKAWLGMTTSNKRKIIKLSRKLHERWIEVKDIQSEVKPQRQRLKNLKYAMMCEERSVAEEMAC
jgi:predicted Fe-S protein YdhL (DUF1289 family)